MNCEQSNQHLDGLLAGELTDETRADLETHLARCPACRHEWETLPQLSRELRAFPHEEPAPSLRRKFYSNLDAYRTGLEANPAQPRDAVRSGHAVPVRRASPQLRDRDSSSEHLPCVQAWIQAWGRVLRPYRFHVGGLATVAALILLFTLGTPSSPEQRVAQTAGSPQEQLLAWQANRRWFAELLEPTPGPPPARKAAVPPRPRSDRRSDQRSA